MFIPLVFKRAVSALWGDTPPNIRYCEASGEVTQGEFCDQSAHKAATRAIYMSRHHI